MARASRSWGGRGTRTFAAVVAPSGVWLVEYHTERTGTRVVEEWSTVGPLASIGEAMDRLRGLVSSTGATRASLALAIEQLGVIHHTMLLPEASDEVVLPIAQREIQRVFGIADPVVSFVRGSILERRAPPRADPRTAPRQIFVAAASREVVAALGNAAMPRGVEITVATVAPSAMCGLYVASGAPLEPTAVLACLDSGPHLAFFLDGKLELVMDPPVAVEGDRTTTDAIVDQLERGTIYFRQQFRGATATRVLLAARADEYDDLAAAIERRRGTRVWPLFRSIGSPEGVVAMGAVVNAQTAEPLDLFPHPPSLGKRVSLALRGPNAIVTGAAAAAILAVGWSSMQFATLSRARTDVAALQASVSEALPAVAPMRRIAERRADFVTTIDYLRNVRDERTTVTRALADIASGTSSGIRFDSVRVVRSNSGWSAVVQGAASGGTTTEAVRGLDAFYSAIRDLPGISSSNLDQFDYPAPKATDSTRRAMDATPVVLEFKVSFAMARVDTALERATETVRP